MEDQNQDPQVEEVTSVAPESEDQITSQANIDEKDAKIAELEKKLEQATFTRMQLMADFENFRKRTEAEKAKFGLIANMSILLQMLEVVDDVQMTLNDDGLNLEGAKQMMQVFQDKLKSTVDGAGLEIVSISKDDKFDPSQMEAITTIPTQNPELDNTIENIISSAYRYKGQVEVLKPAKVIVRKLKK